MSLAILCPGQGGQYPAMFDSVAESPVVALVFATATEVLSESPLDLIASGKNIFRNNLAQPLVCTAILARWKVLQEELPRPSIALGYSVGELAAHVIAGTLTAEDCLRLSRRRAELMDTASPPYSGMTAILGLHQSQVDSLCACHNLAIAIINSDRHFVVGGAMSDLEAFELEAKRIGARTIRIRIGVPSHTPWLKNAVNAFGDELVRVELRKPILPVIAGINGQVVSDSVDAASTLSKQIAQTIHWQRCVDQAVERGAKVMLELGPGSTLVKLVRARYPEYAVRSVDEFKTLAGAACWGKKMLEG